jgi:hypothetical protein
MSAAGAEPLETPTDRRVAELEALLVESLGPLESGAALAERIRAALNRSPDPAPLSREASPAKGRG